MTLQSVAQLHISLFGNLYHTTIENVAYTILHTHVALTLLLVYEGLYTLQFLYTANLVGQD